MELGEKIKTLYKQDNAFPISPFLHAPNTRITKDTITNAPSHQPTNHAFEPPKFTSCPRGNLRHMRKPFSSGRSEAVLLMLLLLLRLMPRDHRPAALAIEKIIQINARSPLVPGNLVQVQCATASPIPVDIKRRTPRRARPNTPRPRIPVPHGPEIRERDRVPVAVPDVCHTLAIAGLGGACCVVTRWQVIRAPVPWVCHA